MREIADDQTSCVCEISAGVENPICEGQSAHGIHQDIGVPANAGSQRVPCPAIPATDVGRGDTARILEYATYIQVGSVHRQCGNRRVGEPDSTPRGAIPPRNAADRHAVDVGEIASHVKCIPHKRHVVDRGPTRTADASDRRPVLAVPDLDGGVGCGGDTAAGENEVVVSCDRLHDAPGSGPAKFRRPVLVTGAPSTAEFHKKTTDNPISRGSKRMNFIAGSVLLKGANEENRNSRPESTAE